MVQKREEVHYNMKNYDVSYQKADSMLIIDDGGQYDDLNVISLSHEQQIELFEILKDILEGE